MKRQKDHDSAIAPQPETANVNESLNEVTRTIVPHLLPDPQRIRELEEMAPGTGARLFDLFTTEVEHRRELDCRSLEERGKEAKRTFVLHISGLILGFLIACVAVICGTLVAVNSVQPVQQVAGGLIGGGGVIGLVALFVRRR